jgi:hypothetical protein
MLPIPEMDISKSRRRPGAPGPQKPSKRFSKASSRASFSSIFNHLVSSQRPSGSEPARPESTTLPPIESEANGASFQGKAAFPTAAHAGVPTHGVPARMDRETVCHVCRAKCWERPDRVSTQSLMPLGTRPMSGIGHGVGRAFHSPARMHPQGASRRSFAGSIRGLGHGRVSFVRQLSGPAGYGQVRKSWRSEENSWSTTSGSSTPPSFARKNVLDSIISQFPPPSRAASQIIHQDTNRSTIVERDTVHLVNSPSRSLRSLTESERRDRYIAKLRRQPESSTFSARASAYTLSQRAKGPKSLNVKIVEEASGNETGEENRGFGNLGSRERASARRRGEMMMRSYGSLRLENPTQSPEKTITPSVLDKPSVLSEPSKHSLASSGRFDTADEDEDDFLKASAGRLPPPHPLRAHSTRALSGKALPGRNFLECEETAVKNAKAEDNDEGRKAFI